MLHWNQKITAIAWAIVLLLAMGMLTAATAAQHLVEKTDLDEITESQPLDEPQPYEITALDEITELDEITKNVEIASKRGFKEEVEQWISELAKLSCCSDWSKANWTSYPLGPGTHAKLIELKLSSGEIAGYFVLSATESGEWILTEYGTGPYPLFGIETLYQALVASEETHTALSYRKEMLAWIEERYEINRLYLHGLESLWVLQDLETNEIIYADAKTAEFYPLTKEDLDEILQTTLSDAAAMEVGWTLDEIRLSMKSASFEVFDPFMHVYWLKAQPEKIQNANQLIHLLEEQPVTFVTALYQESVTDPYAVTGLIHPLQTVQTSSTDDTISTDISWSNDSTVSSISSLSAGTSLPTDGTVSTDSNLSTGSTGTPFVAIDKYGPKYVPFTLLQNTGNFYSQEQ